MMLSGGKGVAPAMSKVLNWFSLRWRRNRGFPCIRQAGPWLPPERRLAWRTNRTRRRNPPRHRCPRPGVLPRYGHVPAWAGFPTVGGPGASGDRRRAQVADSVAKRLRRGSCRAVRVAARKRWYWRAGRGRRCGGLTCRKLLPLSAGVGRRAGVSQQAFQYMRGGHSKAIALLSGFLTAMSRKRTGRLGGSPKSFSLSVDLEWHAACDDIGCGMWPPIRCTPPECRAGPVKPMKKTMILSSIAPRPLRATSTCWRNNSHIGWLARQA